jgi:hypothetical protein
MILDKSNISSLALYYFHNRKHRGEVWLAFQTPTGLLLMEQSGKWPDDSVLMGEMQSRVINGEFVDEIVPVVERSDEELERMQQQTQEHKAYRADLYKQYPIAERLKDLGGPGGENQ